MKRKGFFLVLSLVLITILTLGCSTQSSSDQVSKDSSANNSDQTSTATSEQSSNVIVLKAVTAWPQDTKDNAGLFDLIDKVNELGKGKIQIKYLGGPEVIAMNEQTNALKSGTIDIAWLSAGYTSTLAPASSALKLSNFTAQEERDNGVTDLWNKIFGEQVNAHLLARGSAPDVHFHIFTNKPVKTLSDFKGLPLRGGSAAYQEFFEALGASPVALAPGDVYTALERGTVNGYGWPSYGIEDFGWDKLTKYVIDPGFYQVDCLGLINLDKWKSLPKDVQDIITQASIQVENDMVGHFQQLSNEEHQLLESEGIKYVELSDADAKKFVDMAYEAAWNDVLKNAPKYGQQVKDALQQ